MAGRLRFDRSRSVAPERRASSMRRAASMVERFSRCWGILGYQDNAWAGLVQRMGRLKLLYRGEEFAGGDGGAFFGGDREDAAGAVGLQLVLHFHGFHYDDALAGDDLVAGGGQDADYFAGHGAEDGLHGAGAGGGGFAGPAARGAGFHYDDALAGGHLGAGGGEDADYFAGHGAEDGLHGAGAGGGGFAGPAARVAGFDGETVAFDGDDEAGGGVFDEDVVAAAIEEDGIDAGAGHLHVGVARRGGAELEAAGWGGREDVDGVGAAVDGEREFHRRRASLPADCQGLAVEVLAAAVAAAGWRAVV